MFKVTISNPSAVKYGSPWSASENEDGSPFTEQDANAWLALQIGKPHRLPERSIENEDGSITVIPQEFTSKIIDLSQDKEYLEKQAIEKRKTEYPNAEDVIEALMEHLIEGKPQKLQDIQSQREAIKIKYPKPEKNK